MTTGTYAATTVPEGTMWHGGFIDTKNHWRRRTTQVCEHRHRSHLAALECGVRMANQRTVRAAA